MPRRGGFGRRSTPAPRSTSTPAPRSMSTSSTKSPTTIKPQPPGRPYMQSATPGMLSQIASTAAGVAIGHTIGHAITGGIGGHSSPEAANTPNEQGYMMDSQATQQQASNTFTPCARELEDFIKCTQNNTELKYCEGLNYLFKQCKLDQGFQ